MQDARQITHGSRLRSQARVAPPNRWIILWILGCLVLGTLLLPLDMTIARRVTGRKAPGDVDRLLARAEGFGHAYGAVAICITVALLAPHRRREASRLLAGSLGAGLVADGVKLLVPRWRPTSFDLTRAVGESFLVHAMWQGKMPGGVVWDSRYQSCPSAHTAVAVALACGLAWMYPRGRWWFALLAALCGLNRVVTTAHFPSDVLWGAAVGMAAAAVAFHAGRHRTQHDTSLYSYRTAA